MRLFLALFLACMATNLNAQTSQVPKSLFGVDLGGEYFPPEQENGAGTFPVKRIVSYQRFLGSGVHIYFEPTKTYQNYPYRQYKTKTESNVFETSFRIYAYPDLLSIPPNQIDKLDAPLKYKVTLIEWHHEKQSGKDDKEREQNSYYWAKDFCKTLQLDQRTKAKITDSDDRSLYVCEFREGNRVLYVDSWVNGHFGLKFDQEYTKELDSKIEKIGRKLNFNKDKPY